MKFRNITDSLLKWRILILLQTIQINTAQASTEELGQARAGSNAAANIELTVDELI